VPERPRRASRPRNAGYGRPDQDLGEQPDREVTVGVNDGCRHGQHHQDCAGDQRIQWPEDLGCSIDGEGSGQCRGQIRGGKEVEPDDGREGSVDDEVVTTRQRYRGTLPLLLGSTCFERSAGSWLGSSTFC